MTEHEVHIVSGEDRIAGRLYRATGEGDAPIVVLGHGLAAVKEMRLPAYAERFVAAGYHALVFDYRGFGASGGEPRQVVSRRRQLDDWDAVLRYVRGLAGVDSRRIAIFGSSYGGGLVLNAAVRNPDVAAVIAQCPFTDGLASALSGDPLTAVKLGAHAVRDLAGSVIGRPPHLVPTVAAPGEVGVLTSPDSLQYLGLVPEGTQVPNRMAARFALAVPFQRPGRAIARVTSPVLLCVCDDDLEAPAKATLKHARGTAAQVRRYPLGHFEIYTGAGFEAAVTDQLTFLTHAFS